MLSSKDLLLAVMLAFLLALNGCASMQAPTLLQASAAADQTTKPLSDWQIVQFGESLVKWWGARSMRTEVIGTGLGITLDAVTTGALAASGGGVSPDIARGLIAGVNFIASLIRRIDPAARDNAFNEGAGIVLEAQGDYAKCITAKGNAAPSEKTVSPCGAIFLAKANSAIKVVGSLMAGLMPQKTDLETISAK